MKKRKVFLFFLIIIAVIAALVLMFSRYKISFDYGVTTGPLHADHVLLPAVARGDSLDDIKALIEEKPTSLSEIQLGGITPLYMASSYDNYEVFEFLITEYYKGDRLIEHSTDPGRYSVLHDAIYENKEDRIELILKYMDVRREDIFACDYPFSKLLEKSTISIELKDRLNQFVEN